MSLKKTHAQSGGNTTADKLQLHHSLSAPVQVRYLVHRGVYAAHVAVVVPAAVPAALQFTVVVSVTTACVQEELIDAPVFDLLTEGSGKKHQSPTKVPKHLTKNISRELFYLGTCSGGNCLGFKLLIVITITITLLKTVSDSGDSWLHY